VVAFVALQSIRARLSAQLGTPVPLVTPWLVITGVVSLCLVPAVAASLAPRRR